MDLEQTEEARHWEFKNSGVTNCHRTTHRLKRVGYFWAILARPLGCPLLVSRSGGRSPLPQGTTAVRAGNPPGHSPI